MSSTKLYWTSHDSSRHSSSTRVLSFFSICSPARNRLQASELTSIQVHILCPYSVLKFFYRTPIAFEIFAIVDICDLILTGLCITLLVEMATIKLGIDNVIKKIWVARSAFLVAASFQMVHSIFTYRYNFYVSSSQISPYFHVNFRSYFGLHFTETMKY